MGYKTVEKQVHLSKSMNIEKLESFSKLGRFTDGDVYALYQKRRVQNGTGKPMRGIPLKTLKLIIFKLHYSNDHTQRKFLKEKKFLEVIYRS